MKATDSYLRVVSDSICAEQKNISQTLSASCLRGFRQSEIKTSLLSNRD